MLRIAPFVIAALLIAAITIVEGSITERWSDVNKRALYCASLLDEVPNQIGDWVGKDTAVEGQTLIVAGAEGFVSRFYAKEGENQGVSVWLIVGHARDTAEHTPDTCYPAQGGVQCQGNDRHEIEIDGKTVQFWTGVFETKQEFGTSYQRVFWTWFEPQAGESVAWVAPKGARWYFGSSPALYKLYFTAVDPDDAQPADESLCLEFAKEFMPELNEVLKKANQGVPDDFDPEAVKAEAGETPSGSEDA